MAPRTRKAASPKFVIERDEDSGESSSGEEEEEEVGNVFEDSENDDVEEDDEEEVEETVEDKKSREKRPITISLKKVCKVCKKTGHQAGFQGATYIDCPMKPCFLCKMPGIIREK